MLRKFLLIALTFSLTLCVPLADAWGRGRGGGGGGGGRGGVGGGGGGFSGGGGGFSGGGGGFSGGAGPSAGGFSGGASRSSGGFSSAAGRSPSGMSGLSGGGASRGPGGAGGVSQLGGSVGGPGAAGTAGGRMSGAGVAGTRPGSEPGAISGQGRDRFSTPSSGQLNGFLGLPSDQGMHSLSSSSRSTVSQLPAGDKFDVNYGTAEGPRGGQAAGIAATGPRDNTVGRAVGVGAQGGVAAVGGVQGAGGASAVRGAAVGPGGQVAAGRAVVGPGGAAAGGAVVAGPGGAAAGFTRVSPSGRYTTAAAVRTNYDHWGVYGGGWYTAHPGAWYAAGWASSAAWNACTWNSAAAYCGYDQSPPVYYDYGNNVTYQDNVVYMNGDEVGTTQQFYDQAASLATAGAQADAPADGDWLPLGVFALTKPEQTQSAVSLQLAVNKAGIIRGNYTDTNSDKTQLIQGSVDKQTQRVAFTVGDNQSHLVETGLYNLTKDEAPCLLHFGNERTEQWLLVRLKQSDQQQP